MRLFVAGSTRHLKGGSPEAFEEAARELGREVARREHILLLHSGSKKSIDYHMVEGLKEVARERRTRIPVEVHRALRRGGIYEDAKELDIRSVPYLSEVPARSRLGVRAGGVVASHAVLLMGGTSGTREIGHLAIELKHPVIAIASLGGSGDAIYKDMEPRYLQRPGLQRHLWGLAGPWREGSASAVLEVCEALAYKHSYFISYAHEDAEAADHLEVLLRRKERAVYRDEPELSPGEHLERKLGRDIAIADTFVSLWSRHADGSAWCRKELAFARQSQEQGPRPRRIVLILLDDTPVPDSVKEFFHLAGSGRPGRMNAVAKLTATERI